MTELEGAKSLLFKKREGWNYLKVCNCSTDQKFSYPAIVLLNTAWTVQGLVDTCEGVKIRKHFKLKNTRKHYTLVGQSNVKFAS